MHFPGYQHMYTPKACVIDKWRTRSWYDDSSRLNTFDFVSKKFFFSFFFFYSALLVPGNPCCESYRTYLFIYVRQRRMEKSASAYCWQVIATGKCHLSARCSQVLHVLLHLQLQRTVEKPASVSAAKSASFANRFQGRANFHCC